MNIRLLVFLVAILVAITWLVRGGVISLQEEYGDGEGDAIGNTLDAARNAADTLSR